MTTTEQFFRGVSWSAEDLTSSAWAFDVLVKRGASLEELTELDFGSLDVDARWEELTGDEE